MVRPHGVSNGRVVGTGTLPTVEARLTKKADFMVMWLPPPKFIAGSMCKLWGLLDSEAANQTERHVATHLLDHCTSSFAEVHNAGGSGHDELHLPIGELEKSLTVVDSVPRAISHSPELVLILST